MPAFNRDLANNASAFPAEKLFRIWIPVILMLLFAWNLWRTAWMSDDAYITFRTVHNFVNGFGPVFNIGERVQTFTHPLWMLLVSSIYFFTDEAFYSVTILSVTISLATLVLFAFGQKTHPAGIITGLAFLVVSKAFTDYSTSGLENPLGHLLLLIFLLLFSTEKPGEKLFPLSMTAGLLVLTRMDYILLVIPPILWLFFISDKKIRFIGLFLTGMLPFILWEIFSVIYYGFPFPNTAYAKLNVPYSPTEIASRGLAYFVHSYRTDPATLTGVVTAVLPAFIFRKEKQVWIAVGILLYLVYIIRIGGDFMTGRFFTMPLLASAFLISRLNFQPAFHYILLLFLFAASILPMASPFRSGYQYPPEGLEIMDPKTSIADERAWYFPWTGISRSFNDTIFHIGFIEAEADSTMDAFMNGNRDVSLRRLPAAGFFPYAWGPQAYVADYYGLTDPLMARIPPLKEQDWRIGHMRRIAPEGYQRSVESDGNFIYDPALSEYYDHLRMLTDAPLFTKGRFETMLKMNFGSYDYLLDAQNDPKRASVVTLNYLDDPVPGARALEEDGGIVWTDGESLRVKIGGKSYADSIEINADNESQYLLQFLQQGSPLDSLVLGPATADVWGSAIFGGKIPPEASEKGFDQILITAKGKGLYSIHHLLLFRQPDTLTTPLPADDNE